MLEILVKSVIFCGCVLAMFLVGTVVVMIGLPLV